MVGRVSRASRWLTTSRTPSGLPSSATARANRVPPSYRDRLALEQRAPQLGHQERVAARQLAQHSSDLGKIRTEVAADRALDELGDLLGAETSQPQPHHAFGAAQVDERRRERLRDLGLGVAKRRDHQRASVRRAARQVPKSSSVGVSAQCPSSITRPAALSVQRAASRSATALCRRWRSVSGSAASWRRQLTDPLGQIWQQPRQLPALSAERVSQRRLVVLRTSCSSASTNGRYGRRTTESQAP